MSNLFLYHNFLRGRGGCFEDGWGRGGVPVFLLILLFITIFVCVCGGGGSSFFCGKKSIFFCLFWFKTNFQNVGYFYFIYLFIFLGGSHEPIFWHESSIWVQIRLRAENKLPRWSGSGLKVFGGGWVGFGW